MIDWTSKKTYLLMALILAVGMTLEGLKSRHSSQPNAPREAALQVGDIVPYSRSRDSLNPTLAARAAPNINQENPPRPEDAIRTELLNPHRDKQETSPDKTQALLEGLVEKAEFAHEDSDKTEEDQDTEEEEEFELGETEAFPESEETPPPTSREPDRNLDPESQGQSPNYFVSGFPQEPQDQDPADLDDEEGREEIETLAWTQRLLEEPDFAALTQLIAEYQSGLISAAVFYSVIDRMIADEREEMRRLAGVALVSTPSSSSFVRIADLLQTEAYNSSLRQSLELGLTYYKDLSYVLTLEQVILRDDSSHVLQLAVQQILESAEFHLKNSRQRSLEAENDADNSLSDRAEQVFSRFIAPLKNLAQQGADQNVTAQASSTLTYLEDLLGSSVAISQF